LREIKIRRYPTRKFMTDALAIEKFNKPEGNENIVQLFLANSLLFFKNFRPPFERYLNKTF
jgi:hypothetical protein